KSTWLSLETGTTGNISAGNTRLADQTEYYISVRSINSVGLTSQEMTSDGVLIDTDKKPSTCSNKQKDSNETDTDCGNICGPTCAENKTCNTHDDCTSLYCETNNSNHTAAADNNSRETSKNTANNPANIKQNNISQKINTCQQPSCTDNTQNSKETDIDCGGSCTACDITKKCSSHTDCNTNYCEPRTNTCKTAPPCQDGKLTPGETDIDCGGPCTSKCGQDKTCLTQKDCTQQFTCLNNRCQTCNNNDCGPHSCSDSISDAWRQQYFGAIQCDANGAPDADPDNDGLSNADEYSQHTDPTKKDTDNDGWSDMEELARGTNPVDSSDHPKSKSILLWFRLLLFLIFIAGAVYYRKKWLPALTLFINKTHAITQKQSTKPSPFKKFQQPFLFRKPARQEHYHYLSQEKQVPANAQARAQTEQILTEEIQSKKTKPEQIQSDQLSEKNTEQLTIFERLKLIALQKLPQIEQLQMLKELEKLKKGTLAEEQRQKLFAKLKITSTWYETHKETLHNEIYTWLNKKQ
ncbi:MAG: thrombospondin type 3 repeat-containing protein, partial [Candidatus Woesearchaeota archaeon]|nr:thrombospondin type 3 repeat-containing protein [Candidatus Woesearchaeota archaeon]